MRKATSSGFGCKRARASLSEFKRFSSYRDFSLLHALSTEDTDALSRRREIIGGSFYAIYRFKGGIFPSSDLSLTKYCELRTRLKAELGDNLVVGLLGSVEFYETPCFLL